MTLVDSCIIIDVARKQSANSRTSIEAMKVRLGVGRLFSPDIVFAEVCYGYKCAEDVSRLFEYLKIEVVPSSREVLFRASKAFEDFLARNRVATSSDRLAKRILPDFYIGAFAEVEGIPLLTRDTKRKWHREFPELEIIEPQNV